MSKFEVLPHCDVLLKWGVQDMCEWLKKSKFQEAVPFFKQHNITGEKFLYLSEMQVFQMRNVSVKTKNSLKDAQKSVKGRPSVVPRKTEISQTARHSISKVYDSLNRIMNPDRPPQAPGKDYHHYTPDIDDDGWGSEFSDDECDHQDSYEHPSPQQQRTDEVYEDPQASSGTDSEYEQPLNQPQTKMIKNSPATKSRLNRPLPTPNESPVKTSRPYLGKRELPPEPPQEHEPEDYEDPDNLTPVVQARHTPPAQKHLPPAQKHLPPAQKHLPPPSNRKKSPPRARSPRRHSPPAISSLPPPLPRRDNAPVPDVKYEVANTNNSNSDLEDYEEPNAKMFTPQPKPAPVNSEIILKPGKLKPSLVKNYTKVDIANKGNPLLTAGGPVKPSQIREKNITATPHNIRSPAVNSRVLPAVPQEDTLENLNSYTWFHCDMSRDVAKERLTKKAKNGMFLVRKSSQANSPYALSLFYKGRVYNLNIRRRPDNQYALGVIKTDEKAFASVSVLIAFFQSSGLVLGGDPNTQTKLLQSLPK